MTLPAAIEDALRTAWCSTRHPSHETVAFWRAWGMDGCPYRLVVIDDTYGQLGACDIILGVGSEGMPAWSLPSRAAVDALPEYQAWRKGLEGTP